MTEEQLAKSPAFAGLTPAQIALRIAAINRAGEHYAKHAHELWIPSVDGGRESVSPARQKVAWECSRRACTAGAGSS